MSVNATEHRPRLTTRRTATISGPSKRQQRQHDASAGNRTLLRKNVFALFVALHQCWQNFGSLQKRSPSPILVSATKSSSFFVNNSMGTSDESSPSSLLYSSNMSSSIYISWSTRNISEKIVELECKWRTSKIVFNKQCCSSFRIVFARPFYFWVLPFNIKLSFCFFDYPIIRLKNTWKPGRQGMFRLAKLAWNDSAKLFVLNVEVFWHHSSMG